MTSSVHPFLLLPIQFPSLVGMGVLPLQFKGEESAAVPEIVRRVREMGFPTPIIGDYHYQGHVLLEAYPECARALDKYRINPGNVGGGDRTREVRVAQQILQSMGMRQFTPQVTACPAPPRSRRLPSTWTALSSRP